MHIAASVATVGELQLGDLTVSDRATRARRGATLEMARRFDLIRCGEAVMAVGAAHAGLCGRGVHRAGEGSDALIAATAIEDGLASSPWAPTST